MACAVSTLTATPRDDTCAEIGAVEKVAAANSRPMSDPVLIASLCLAPTEWAPPIKRTALTARAIQHTLGVWIEPLSHNAAKQNGGRLAGRQASARKADVTYVSTFQTSIPNATNPTQAAAISRTQIAPLTKAMGIGKMPPGLSYALEGLLCCQSRVWHPVINC